MKKKDRLFLKLPSIIFFFWLSIKSKLQIPRFSFFLPYCSLGEWVSEEGGDSDLCRGLKNCVWGFVFIADDKYLPP